MAARWIPPAAPLATTLNAITVTGDSTLTDSAATQSRFGSLTFAARSGGVTDPTVLTFSTGGAIFTGGLTLTGGATFVDAATGSTNNVAVEGAVTGTGAFNKFGAGTVQLAGAGFRSQRPPSPSMPGYCSP